MLKHHVDVALRGFLGYDRFHPDAERIYRLGRDIYPREDFAGLYTALLPLIAAAQLEEDYPEMEATGRAMPTSGQLRRGDEVFFESSLLFADPSLVNIFGFEWLAGNPFTALDSPTAIVLTETLARKYFGDEAALGQVLTYENNTDLTVSGDPRPAGEHTSESGWPHADGGVSQPTAASRP